MKKLAFALSALAALTLLAPTSGIAQDPPFGTMGIYFDTDATVYEMTSAAYAQVPAYVCVVDHGFDNLFGYEFGYTIDGNHTVISVAMQGSGPIDVGGVAGNHIVGLAAPMVADPVTVVCILTVFVLDDQPITFTLTGAEPNSVVGSVTPAVLLAGDAIKRCGTSGWDADAGMPTICAAINGTDPVIAVDQTSLDAVKSLYR